ncbi:hypothetical protein C900_02204 [Fulvivirga imtechensis AK7]|uniref:Uncharacterized protein n=1 Tax=Fulvivirga imtechensis AK7 TaxID=1237149 RepID=L8JW43_9BACT|nr:biotin/lipoyl-binding protein [Fulvivirga imtechensis]ELR71829.1 hypothetical protein C900_02204 [Fulvivirga imtechensis AK7]
MNATKIISIVLLLASLSLGYYLVNSVKSEIDEKEAIAQREAAVIEKLKLIREAEIAYLEVKGSYTSDWDKLINFIKYDSFPIIQRKERVVTLSYGADSSIITYDTLGIISAKERIFRASYNINAANDGVFQEFLVNTGSKVAQGQGAYVLNQNGKNVTHKFRHAGKVVKLENIFEGQQVTKGDLLITLEQQKFDPDIDIDRLAYVPGYDNVKFTVYAAKVDKSGVSVDVIEVANPKPFNRERSEDADVRTKKPLRFGSKTDVTTSGNWE